MLLIVFVCRDRSVFNSFDWHFGFADSLFVRLFEPPKESERSEPLQPQLEAKPHQRRRTFKP